MRAAYRNMNVAVILRIVSIFETIINKNNNIINNKGRLPNLKQIRMRNTLSIIFSLIIITQIQN